MFRKVLIANRGAIACRIMRTLRQLGVQPVCVYTTADADSAHVLGAEEALWLGEGPAAGSYLEVAKILDAARRSGAEAIHPGYGFLSENADFAQACEDAGIAFIGPTPKQMRAFGLKHTARALAVESGVPLLPGTALLPDVATALSAAERIGYPVMLKGTAGGGGIGMQRCDAPAELAAAFDRVSHLARTNFADGGVFLEKFVARARHLEVQIFGDGEGRVVHLGERDCSLQRRNQKVIEETPAPRLDAATREALCAHAVRLGEAAAYRSAGTVEYVYDVDTREFHFLEVNTRLQVEHGVTEEVTGIDLVAWMVRLAAGDSPLRAFNPSRAQPRGHAIQARIYAEDPARHFQPSAGLLTDVAWPTHTRCDTWVAAGVEVPPFYDPLLGKVIVHAESREAALTELGKALDATRLAGIETNLGYLRSVVDADAFRSGTQITATLAGHTYAARSLEVLAAGTETTVQDWPGRQGYWNVGIPPSGPFDARSHRLVNRLVGNSEDAAALEITVSGPTLRFNAACTVALGGAPVPATLDGAAIPMWQAVQVAAGSVLAIGAVGAVGMRAYLALRGGLDVPRYLGSRATFTLGRFGGHGGRALQIADVLHLGNEVADAPAAIGANDLPAIGNAWQLRVVYGPHGAPDFFTAEDIAQFFTIEWEVHYNSSRTGVRLIGPKPEWARPDGGEAGLHPSNLHDNAYAIGTVDFTGDMPVILGPDGPSLGGFVCPATVIEEDLWCLGQLRAGDRIRFVPVAQYREGTPRTARPLREVVATPVPLLATPATESGVGVVYRPAGDRNLLVEFGPPVLDIELRFRAQALLNALEAARLSGVIDLTPGIRSLQIHFDPKRLSMAELLAETRRTQAGLASLATTEVPSRIVYLPLSFDDPSTRLAIERYMQSVRSDAPWCPDNLEFIRRINGLESIDDVRRIVFDASWLVMGLGDVYLGAPVATPLDPRHRMVTTKYNPARTWTPENAVGIGGAYLCVYGMEGPGGYQFVGRTIQMWNRHRATPEFTKPWLLRFFDQIRFFPVSATELTRLREDFPRGRYRLRIEETRFDLAEYQAFLAAHDADISQFRAHQRQAFDAERGRWQAAGLDLAPTEPEPATNASKVVLAPGERSIASHVHGSVWQLRVAEGQRMQRGGTLVLVESMKMEIAVVAEADGIVTRVLAQPGARVTPGQPLVVMAP